MTNSRRGLRDKRVLLQSSSFSSDYLILDDGNVSFVSVEADLVAQWEVRSLAVAEWQR